MLKVFNILLIVSSIALFGLSLYELIDGRVFVSFCHRGVDPGSCFEWVDPDRSFIFWTQIIFHFSLSWMFYRACSREELKDTKTYKNSVWRTKLYGNRRKSRRR